MPHRIALIVFASFGVLGTGHATAQPAGGGSRAEEEASRPMRLILEAAKIKPKSKPADAPPPARPAAAPAKPAATAAASVAPGAVAAPAAPAVAADSPPSLPESTVATVEAAVTPRQPDPTTLPAPLSEPAVPREPEPALPPPKLRNLVEPVTPRHLAGRLRGEVRVEVQLNVAADGSVSDAAVTSSSHPQMNAAVLDAVRQWRYEPAARAREHAVQVVLRPDS